MEWSAAGGAASRGSHTVKVGQARRRTAMVRWSDNLFGNWQGVKHVELHPGDRLLNGDLKWLA